MDDERHFTGMVAAVNHMIGELRKESGPPPSRFLGDRRVFFFSCSYLPVKILNTSPNPDGMLVLALKTEQSILKSRGVCADRARSLEDFSIFFAASGSPTYALTKLSICVGDNGASQASFGSPDRRRDRCLGW